MRSIRASARTLAHRLAVGGGADAKAFLGERARHQIADLAMVVDDQDVRASVHAANLVRGGPLGANKLSRSLSDSRL